jgi:hypothetical protein
VRSVDVDCVNKRSDEFRSSMDVCGIIGDTALRRAATLARARSFGSTFSVPMTSALPNGRRVRKQSDPSGSGPFWHPNSGNIIGTGWSDGSRSLKTAAICAGTDTAAMAKAIPKPTGLGWHPNSGNVIGTDWIGFQHIFGGSDGSGGYVIYDVEHGGNLRWYRYSGNGESDPSDTSAAWDSELGKHHRDWLVGPTFLTSAHSS